MRGRYMTFSTAAVLKTRLNRKSDTSKVISGMKRMVYVIYIYISIIEFVVGVSKKYRY